MPIVMLEAVCVSVALKAVESRDVSVSFVYEMYGIRNMRCIWDMEIRVLQLLNWKIPNLPLSDRDDSVYVIV